MFAFQAELQGEETPENIRIATSTANKAHSWRGDHPMKSGAYFISNPPPPTSGSYYAHQSKTFNPYSQSKPTYEFGQKTAFLQHGAGKVVHNGIRLVGLANSPNNESK